MKWIEGRQGTGYFKHELFFSGWLGFDCYILKYLPGSYIPPHKDQIACFRHHRLNIELKKAKIGGYCYIHGDQNRWWRFTYFRPDIQEHAVSEVVKGTRYVLSIGWVSKL